MNLTEKKSLNHNDRKNGIKPYMLILHYTGTVTAFEADTIYMTPDRVSPHYMIDQDARVIKYVAEDKRAWHAGLSSWGNETDINSASIGIEVVNGGHDSGLPLFPETQISGLIELINDIRSRWNIADACILGHSDIAPGRKLDPGEHFPWAALHERGIGLMPRMTGLPREIDTPVELQAALREWGYSYTNDADLLIREFRRHYMADDFDKDFDLKATCAAIASLFEQKN